MRRAAGLLLLCVGVFALALAVVLPTVVVSQSKRTPLDLDITQVSTGQAQLLDKATQKPQTVNLRATRIVRSDSSASDSKRTTVNESLCIVVVRGDTPNCVRSSDPRLLKLSTDRVTADRKTGESVHVAKYRENVDGDTSVRHEGLSYKFPIDTEKKIYQFFLPELKKAFPAKYVGEDEIRGLTVYKFVSETGDQPYKVQGVFDGTFNDTRTVWVEPDTGAIINGEEHQVQTIVNAETNEKLVALDARLKFSDAAIDYQSNFAKGKIDDLKLAQLWGPLIAGVLGIGALVGAFFLLRRRRGASPDDLGGAPGQEQPRPDSDPSATDTDEDDAVDPNERTRPIGSLSR